MNTPLMIQPATLELIRSRFTTLYAVYVFGSRASNTAQRNSDLDLAILGQPTLSRTQRFDLSDEIALMEHCEVDLIDLFHTTTVMQHQVITTGKRIYVEGSFADEYEIFISSNYEDLQIGRRDILEDILRRRSVYGRRYSQ